MKYYYVLKAGYDYFNKYGTVDGELLTEIERHRNARNIPDRYFKEVEINKNDTYVSFGARYIYSNAIKEYQEKYPFIESYKSI